MTVTVRPARASDREAMLALIPRLRAFGTPPLRDAESLDRAERETIALALERPEEDAVLLVADVGTNAVAGVAYAQTHTDYFTGERHGHLGILAVAESVEGQGVGRALLEAVEGWTRSMGYRFLTLNVFAGNTRAREVYARAGFREDTVRCYKEMDVERPRG